MISIDTINQMHGTKMTTVVNKNKIFVSGQGIDFNLKVGHFSLVDVFPLEV